MVKNKNRIRFYLHIYKLILIQDLKSKMSYRSDFIISMVGIILTNISGFLAFYVLFQNFPDIMGWDYHEILFLYGFTLLALTPVQCFFDNNWNLWRAVYSGDFTKYCFRPINTYFYFISEVFDTKGVGQFFFGVGTLIYAWERLKLPFTVNIFLLLMVSWITASMFMVAIMNFAAATSFVLLDSTYVMILVFKFKDYARYPITIFKPVLRFLLTFIIPIAFISYYPSLFFVRPDQVSILSFLSLPFSFLFFYASYWVWMKGAMFYSGTGS